MNDYFQHNRRSLFILAGLFFILAIVLYFILLRPLFQDVESKESEVVLKEEEIDMLQAQLDEAAVVTEEQVDQLLLENRIPLERKLDDYIISLQRLEAVTDSKILKVEFMYDSNLEMPEAEETEESAEESETTEDTIEELETPEEEEAEEVEEDEETEPEVEENETEELTVDPQLLHEKPEKLQVITVRLTGGIQEFTDLIELLEAIENAERISIVTSLSFEQPTEEDVFDLTDNPLEYIPFEAELTTFYYTE